mmetsp:Transcript_28357/g.92605  ORF Transcript_28357/g.92605 Transcript_28357/m.92605 type:complete len:258 (-) Transcript_28357:119-892(-)
MIRSLLHIIIRYVHPSGEVVLKILLLEETRAVSVQGLETIGDFRHLVLRRLAKLDEHEHEVFSLRDFAVTIPVHGFEHGESALAARAGFGGEELLRHLRLPLLHRCVHHVGEELPEKDVRQNDDEDADDFPGLRRGRKVAVPDSEHRGDAHIQRVHIVPVLGIRENPSSGNQDEDECRERVVATAVRDVLREALRLARFHSGVHHLLLLVHHCIDEDVDGAPDERHADEHVEDDENLRCAVLVPVVVAVPYGARRHD